MNAHDFLKAMSIVLGVAAFTTVLFQRLKQPVVLGYILAGLIVGPHVPIPLVADSAVVHTLSELGVILLMFSLGLEFSLSKLVKVGPTAGLTAVIQCSVMGWLGYLLARWMGWTNMESLFAGTALAVSSTTIIAKAFDEQKVGGRLKDLVVGILIVEDLISVLAMAALTAIAKEGALSGETLLRAGGQLAVFLLVMLALGLWLIPKAMRLVVNLGVEETTVVASVGLCFVCALAAMESGYSVALGAFLGGSLVAESGTESVVERLVRPLRDMFAAIFFVSVGMLLDPALVLEHWRAVVAFTLLVVVGKVLSVALGALLTGNGVRTSTQAGLSLAQIGEFSFIIAGLGLALNATGTFIYPVVVAVSVATTLLTPFLIRSSGPVAEWVDRKLPAPLQTFNALYAAWIERLAQSPDRAALGNRVWSLAKLLLLDAAVILLLTVMTVAYERELAAYLDGRLHRGPETARLLVVLLAALTSTPFFLAIVKVTRAMGALLAEAVFPSVDTEKTLDLAAAPRRLMVASVQWVVSLLVGLPLLALTQPLLQSWQAGALLALLLGGLGWSFWRHASDLQGHVRAGSEMLAERLSQRLQQGLSHEDLDAGHDDLLPGMGDPVSVRLGEGCRACGQSLGSLKLRGATGATALVLIRADGSTSAPLAGQTLRAGDTLVLAGSRSAVDAARQLLTTAP